MTNIFVTEFSETFRENTFERQVLTAWRLQQIAKPNPTEKKQNIEKI